MKYLIMLSALLAMVAPSSVKAQVTEIRAGLAEHDLGWSIINADGDEERSVALNAEIIFAEPEFLKWALSPQPYIGGTLNLEGQTSYGGFGLLWRQSMGERFYGDFAIGLVIHDGILDVDDLRDNLDPGQSLLGALGETNLYGSRILFRPQITVGAKLSDDWAVEAFIEHISHGGLLSSGPNEGSDAAGFRLARRF